MIHIQITTDTISKYMCAYCEDCLAPQTFLGSRRCKGCLGSAGIDLSNATVAKIPMWVEMAYYELYNYGVSGRSKSGPGDE